MKGSCVRRRALRRWAGALCLAALVALTVPLAGFRPQAVSGYTDYEQGLLGAGFPESYVHLLSRLHAQHPSWTFEAYHTGLNWAQAVSAECSGGRSLAVSSAAEDFKSRAAGCYDPATGAYTFVESGYVTASEFAVSYYMDPRNFLREEYILQFESLAYHATENELQVVRTILAGSALDGDVITYKNSHGETMTIETSYAQAILEAGQRHGVNPFYLASKIRNEVGSGGATISGTVAGYEGLYNFYNIYAYGASSVQQSLAWAGSGTTYSRPWTTPVRSIDGGAEYIAAGYLAGGQTTSYFQRFNVVRQPYYNHQYMTAIHGAAEEACNAYRALSPQALDAPRTFIIPVYSDMPQASAYLADGITLENYLGSGVANASVNLRSSPTTSASNLSGHVLPQGTAVTILEEVRSSGTDFMKYPYWYRVSYEAGGGSYDGYVCAQYVNVSYTQTSLAVGASLQLRYQLTPAAAGEVPAVSTSDGAVATVDGAGTVYGVGVGVAYITARVNNGSRVTACLSVVPGDTSFVAVSELMLNAEQLSLGSGETFQLAAQIYPQDATLRTITWRTDNASVATVGADGVVKAVGGGTATVVAASANGVYATCRVTVNAPVIEEPASQSSGLVDLETSLEDLQQTKSQLQAAIEAAEKLDAEISGLLSSLDDPLPQGGESTAPEAPADDPLTPGWEDEIGHVSAPATQNTSFAVSVAAADGTPVTDAAVVLKSASGKLVSTARHVADGQYIFEHILNGSYTVEATGADGAAAAVEVQLREGELFGPTQLQLSAPVEQSRLGLYLALGIGGAALAAAAVGGVVVGVRRRKGRRRRRWYGSM